jgi:hypothetical protein
MATALDISGRRALGLGMVLCFALGCASGSSGGGGSAPAADEAAHGGGGAAAPSGGGTETGGAGGANAESGAAAGTAAPPDDSDGTPNSGAVPPPPSGVMPPPAGTFTPGAELDPDAKFEWPEWHPDAADVCQAGTYTGTYECTFTDTSGAFVVQLTGPVSLTFVKSMDGEFLEISNGRFDAVANLIIGATASIVGRLDCTTLMLNAMAVDGMWSIGDPDFPLIPGGALEGDITGTLDSSSGELSGEWTFGDPMLGACPGTWSVRYQP